MSPVVLVIGGCRSGKSGFALEVAEKISCSDCCFIATSLPLDNEMKDRIRKHQEERGPVWTTIESPIRLPESIVKSSDADRVLLVDCITMWLSNLILDEKTAPHIPTYVRDLKAAMKNTACPVILVSNEVGTGIVPENRLVREYRDLVGSVNQELAGLADHVVMVVAGIPVWIKGKEKDLIS